jgi:hypothetical protein
MSDYGQSARKNFWGNVRNPAGAGEYRPSEPRLTTCRGILYRLWKYQLRLLCPDCRMMESVTDIVDVQDNPRSVTVDCELSCTHCRNLTIPVRSQFCDECDSCWIRGQWCHETRCGAKEQVTSERPEILPEQGLGK